MSNPINQLSNNEIQSETLKSARNTDRLLGRIHVMISIAFMLFLLGGACSVFWFLNTVYSAFTSIY